jgi:hypothetical protein
MKHYAFKRESDLIKAGKALVSNGYHVGSCFTAENGILSVKNNNHTVAIPIILEHGGVQVHRLNETPIELHHPRSKILMNELVAFLRETARPSTFKQDVFRAQHDLDELRKRGLYDPNKEVNFE